MKKKKIWSLLLTPIIFFSIPTYLDFKKNNFSYETKIKTNMEKESQDRNLVSNFTDKPYTIINQALFEESKSIVILAEGYTKDEQNKFLIDAKRMSNYLLNSQAYSKIRNYLNIYAVPIVSNQKSNIYKKQDTFFETSTSVPGGGRDVQPFRTGIQKAEAIAGQIQKHVLNSKYEIKPHILINSNQYGGSASSVAASTLNEKTFTHEQSHLFGMGDEYDIRSFNINKEVNGEYEGGSNNSLTPEIDKLPWKEFLGYNNTGIVKVYKAYIPSVGTCAMKSSSYDVWCEVCKFFIFNNATSNLKNKLVYYGKPVITESFDETKQNEFNVFRNALKSDYAYIARDKFVDIRTIINNPTNQTVNVKLKFSYTHINESTNLNISQQKEQTFEIKPWERKQIKITSDEKIQYLDNNNKTEIKAELFDITNGTEELVEISTDQNINKEFKVNFIDKSTNEKLKFINSNTYYYRGDDSYLDTLKQIDIKGYKKVSSSRNGNEINWY